MTINQVLPDSLNTIFNDQVLALAIQPDGKVLVGGNFTFPRKWLARLNANGSLDTNFPSSSGGTSLPISFVSSLAFQEDGKLLVAGNFTNLATKACTNLGRLNLDGSLDTAFNSFPSSFVNCLAIQPDGSILVGGTFITIGNQTRHYLARLSAAGLVDPSFNPNPSALIDTLALQPDGKILAGGAFTSISGQPRNGLARLNSTGTIDSSFNPNANGGVLCVALQPDSKILVGGTFTNIAGQARKNLARLNQNGTLDSAFNPVVNNPVRSVCLQTDGKILIAGSFTNLAGTGLDALARLYPDGTPEIGFAPQPASSPFVNALAIQVDGNILAGGAFSSMAGLPRANIARLLNTESSVETLAISGSDLTWFRSDASPEVWRVKFESSTNGVDWLNLGSGTRFSGGWQLTGAALPKFAAVRARGFAIGGRFNGSSWIIESTRPALSPSVTTPLQVDLSLLGSAGQKLVVEASTDLSNWMPLATNTITNGPVYFSDTGLTNFPTRFYRARAK